MSVDVAISAKLGDFTLNVAFQSPGAGICGIFGPSGSGKSSLLRCIAGLCSTTSGHVRVGDDCWMDTAGGINVPNHRRAIGFVFQNPCLFDHLSVKRNLEYGWNRVPTQDRRIEFDTVIQLLGLEHLLKRSPPGLSGGERQRVAMGRALLTSPRFLLLDEPLSAIDQQGRDELLSTIETVRDRLAIPMLYVSHSVREISRLAGYLVVLDRGSVTCSGTMAEMNTRSASPLVHGSDAGVTLSATVLQHDTEYNLTYLACGGGRIAVSHIDKAPGTSYRVFIKARDVALSLSAGHDTSVLNSLPAVVTDIAPDGPAHCLVCLTSASESLVAHVTRKSADVLDLKPGRQVFANIKTVALFE